MKASVRPDDRTARRGPDATTIVVVRPDDRAEPRGPGLVPTAPVRPDDLAEPRGPGSALPPVAVAGEAFSVAWYDAGIGAAVGALAVALLAWVVHTRSTHRRGGPGRRVTAR